MTETNFQQLYDDYELALENANDSLKQKCINILHQHIYKYPIRRYRSDAETASEFYSYVVEDIEGYFERYEKDYGISFLVYLSVRLRNSYLNYIRSKEKEKKQTLQADLTFQDEINLNDDELNPEEVSQYKIMRTKLLDSFSLLEQDENVVVRLTYCFPLLLNQFRILLKKHKSVKFFHLYRKYLVEIRDWELKQKSQKEQIAQSLNAIENALQQEIQQQKEISDKIKKREKLISQIYSVKSPVTLKQVSVLIKEGMTFVHRRLKTAKEKIESWFSQRYQHLAGNNHVK